MDIVGFYAIALCTLLLAILSFYDKFAGYRNRSIFHGRPWMKTTFFGKLWVKITYVDFFTILSIYLTKYNLKDGSTRSSLESIIKHCC